MTNPCFLHCSTDSLPCDHLWLGESGPDCARHLPNNSTYWSTWLERLNWIFLAHYPFASPYYTVCQINTLPDVAQALPLAQTNKQMGMQFYCLLVLVWNELEFWEIRRVCSLLENPASSPNSVLWILLLLSRSARSLDSYFRLKNIKSSYVGGWVWLRMGFTGLLTELEESFRNSRYGPRRLPFFSF